MTFIPEHHLPKEFLSPTFGSLSLDGVFARRYFYKKERRRKIESIRQRVIYEATMSIELASVVREKLSENGYKRLPVEIHLDVGENGDTRDIIKELVGMVRGSGYEAVTKPDSYGASKVADRHSK
jgi:predicted RNase H-related nuclease YkuK (DUF458 family)